MHFFLVEVAVLFQPLEQGVLQRLVIGEMLFSQVVFQWAKQSKICYSRHQIILLL